jgi:hypothetical protein
MSIRAAIQYLMIRSSRDHAAQNRELLFPAIGT